MDTVSSFVNIPPPKKSRLLQTVTDFSLSSSGGNPHVLAWRTTSQHELTNNTIQKSIKRILLNASLHPGEESHVEKIPKKRMTRMISD